MSPHPARARARTRRRSPVAHTAALLLGAALAPAHGGVQSFYVDFDTIADTPPGSPGRPADDFIYDYTPEQRAFILDYLNRSFAPYALSFVAGTKPAPGAGSNITLNAGAGAGAEQIDFRNLDGGDDAKVNIISVFETFLGVTDYSDDDVAIATANAIAHEAEHLVGMRHHDKASPIGLGIGGGLFPSDFLPAYPGPASASASGATFASLHAGGALSFPNLAEPKVVSERVIPRLLLAEDAPGFTVAEAGGNNAFADAQPIDPAFFAKPYPLTPAAAPDLIDGRALVVTGALDIPGLGGGFVSDYYSFSAEEGEPWTIEAMSYILPDPASDGERYPDNADVALVLLAGPDAPAPYGPGVVIGYYSDPFGAMNDDDDDADDVPGSKPFDNYRGATIIDVVLPYTGSYVVEVLTAAPFLGTGKDGSDGGAYELYLYTAKGVTLPRCSPADLFPDFILNEDDVVAFLEKFEIGRFYSTLVELGPPAADADASGELDFFDPAAFLNAIAEGCDE